MTEVASANTDPPKFSKEGIEDLDDDTVKSRQVRVHWGKNEEIEIEEKDDDENWSDYEDIADELEDETGDFTKKLNAVRLSYPQVGDSRFSKQR